MVNWRESLKEYIAKKLGKKLGYTIGVDNIKTLDINVDVDLGEATIDELAMIYTFALMEENYEKAGIIKDKLDKLECKITHNLNHITNTGAIEIYLKPKLDIPYVDIKIKIFPEGIMVDWEAQKF